MTLRASTTHRDDTAVSTEAAGRADFSAIRYAQCWEDADVLLAGLAIEPGDTCLAIASAGDNALAMLTADPAAVYAVDLSPAQLACVALRVAAYRALAHDELLELVGSRPSGQRAALYQRCRPLLDDDARAFWDAHPALIAAGIGAAGRFERYFATFRRAVLPWVHRRATVERLLRGGDHKQRHRFYNERWNNRRWRWMFRLFFSRFVMGRLGRDPAFFRYVEGEVGPRILQRARHALTELDPADNPYLQWILTGRHTSALPLALRPEHFETIRANVDRLHCRLMSIEQFLDTGEGLPVNRFNLSDIFEYMSEANTASLLRRLVECSRPGGRLAYWNMLVPRQRPADLADRLQPLTALADELHARDKAFFYSRFVVEEVR